jgi:CRISPR system Cascade subunit CasB
MSQLLEELRKCKARDDRGMMANLRCILVENKKHRAWPALNRLGVAINDDDAAFIAGLYATHNEGEESFPGNFGSTCKAIEQRKDVNRGDESKLTPTERRFQQLLAAERGEELYSRILRMVLMAKSTDVPVNYEQLASDLKKGAEQRKRKWAVSFWNVGAPSEPEEEE